MRTYYAPGPGPCIGQALGRGDVSAGPGESQGGLPGGGSVADPRARAPSQVCFSGRSRCSFSGRFLISERNWATVSGSSHDPVSTNTGVLNRPSVPRMDPRVPGPCPHGRTGENTPAKDPQESVWTLGPPPTAHSCVVNTWVLEPSRAHRGQTRK